MPDWKTQFTNPAKQGEDQGTTFIHTKTEDSLSEIPKTKMNNEAVTRGEKRFSSFPRAI